MRTTQRTTAALFALILAGCSGGGGTGTGAGSIPAPAQAPVAPQSSTSAIDYGAAALKGAAYRGSAQLGTVDLGVLVKMHDAPGLFAYAKGVSDPHSGSYRHFLTPAEIADRFAATASDYAAVEKYFTSRGIAVMGWKQRELLRVRGSQKAMEAALGAHFADYARNGIVFHSLASAPAALSGLPIAALVGATNYARLTKRLVKPHAAASTTGYSPEQVAAAFDYTGAYGLGYTGAGINVGIIGTGPIDPLDLSTFKAIYHVAGASTVTQVDVTNASAPLLPPTDHGFSTPPPTTDNCTTPATGPDATCNPEDVEAQLDTEQVATLARDARVFFYLAYAANADGAGDNYEGIQLVEYEIQQAIQDNAVDVISMSFGAGELDDAGAGGDFVVGTNGQVDTARSVGPTAFATLAAQGITAFGSSGDWGATECLPDNSTNQNALCVDYPATDPNVVAVGGVNAPLSANGQFVGPITGWGLATGGGQYQTAAGGGVSAYFPAPSYQVGASGIVGSTRNTPDVSLDGDGFTGVAVLADARYSDSRYLGPVGGTSIAAPDAAAMWALVLEACKANPSTCSASPGSGGVSYRLGNPNPVLYALYANSTTYAATFFDVLFGNNSQLPGCVTNNPPATTCPQPNPTLIPGYSATNGYDRITGIGVPFARPLIKAVAGV
jgi:kumamolisin